MENVKMDKPVDESLKAPLSENLSPENLKEIGNAAEEGLAVAKETLQKFGENLGTSLTGLFDRGNEFLRGNPNRAVFAGVALGLIAGLLLRPKRAF
jgi:ElaB/YqjD/DUF883 family membrane-anchored ribosome-binding protein